MYMLRENFMPRKLIDQWADKIRNAFGQCNKLFMAVSIYKMNFVWGPTVNKEIGINFSR